mgnify:CR=1 FL=1
MRLWSAAHRERGRVMHILAGSRQAKTIWQYQHAVSEKHLAEPLFDIAYESGERVSIASQNMERTIRSTGKAMLAELPGEKTISQQE